MSKPNTKSVFHDALVGAAVSGLLLTGCASDDPTSDAPRELGQTQHTNLTVADFKAMCEERAGLTQVHAACSGTNACRGLILNSWATEEVDGVPVSTIVEHTCRGFNSCLGISCVDMPADSGKTGQEIYEETCMGCHAVGGHDAENANLTYAVYYKPGADPAAALAAFEAKSEATLINNVAFGSMGYLDDGTPYSNMPAYHEELSLAEVRRVVEHVVGLEIHAEEQKLLGVNDEIAAPEDEH